MGWSRNSAGPARLGPSAVNALVSPNRPPTLAARMLWQPALALCTFLVLFSAKLHQVADVPLILLVILSSGEVFRRPQIPRCVWALTAALALLLAYASFISLLYRANELIWPLKFGRSALLVFLLYFF